MNEQFWSVFDRCISEIEANVAHAESRVSADSPFTAEDEAWLAEMGIALEPEQGEQA